MLDDLNNNIMIRRGKKSDLPTHLSPRLHQSHSRLTQSHSDFSTSLYNQTFQAV